MPQSLNAPRGSKPRSDAKPVEPSAPAPIITPRAVNPEDAAAAAAAKRRARDAYAAGNLAGCEEELGSALTVDGKNPALYTYRSLVELKQGRVAAAMRDVDQAIELDPLSPRGH